MPTGRRRQRSSISSTAPADSSPSISIRAPGCAARSASAGAARRRLSPGPIVAVSRAEQRAVLGAGPHRDRARQRGRQRLHDDAEILRARLAGADSGSSRRGASAVVGREIAQRAAPGEIAAAQRAASLPSSIRDPVAEPDARSCPAAAAALRAGRAPPCGRPATASAAAPAPRRGHRGADRRERRRRLVRRERRRRDQDDLAVFALGLGEKIGRRRLPRRPVARRRPAVVDDEDHRPVAGEARLRIEQRMGQREDDQRRQRPCAAGSATAACAPASPRAASARAAAGSPETRCGAAPAA